MFCDRLLAAGGVALLLIGCGAKGPPKPPLSHAPQPARDVFVRQSGGAIEVRWLRPRQRLNGDSIVGPMTFRVMARPVDRTPVPPSAATSPGTSGARAAPATAASGDMVPGAPPPPVSPGTLSAPGSSAPSPGGSAGTTSAAARANEQAFLRDAEVVAEIVETPEQAAAASAGAKAGSKTGNAKDGGAKAGSAKIGSKKAVKKKERTGKPGADEGAESPGGAKAKPGSEGGAPETQYSVLLGPDRFPGTRFTSVRLAIAVVALDARGHRAAARPIIEIDPVETLTAPNDLRAAGTPEGIALSWRVPTGTSSSFAPGGATGLVERSGVDIYRAELPGFSASHDAAATAAGATGSASGAPTPAGASPQAAGSTVPPQTGAGVPATGSAMPRFPYKPMTGSPFTGESAVDRTAVIGTTYLYEARRVSLAPGKGLRESASSGVVRIDFADVFPPGQPTLVTALAVQADGKVAVKIAWSSPIDADVAGYRIYRSLLDPHEGKPGAEALTATVPAGQIEWTDTAVQPGATYRYSVATIDVAVPPNESARSEAVDISVPAEGS